MRELYGGAHLGLGLRRETQHEEAAAEDAAVGQHFYGAADLRQRQILAQQALQAFRGGLHGHGHLAHAHLLQQVYGMFLHQVRPDGVGEAQRRVQAALQHQLQRAVEAVLFEISDVVEYLYILGAKLQQAGGFLRHAFRRAGAEILAEDLVAVHAAVRAAARGEHGEVRANAGAGHAAPGPEPLVVYQVPRRERQGVQVRYGRARF